ncbi:MAG: ABC transporter permease [Deltaproteobacteria bacterium]|nr:ABC transporter permease [Deltaproteobacteria bacterium]
MKTLRYIITFISIATIGFLYLPLAAMALFSFNRAKYGFIWEGFTLNWYIKLFENQAIIEAAFNTLTLAIVSTIVSTIIGSALAIGMQKFPWSFKTQKSLNIMLYLPVAIPDIILAAALVIIFGILRGVSSIFNPGLINMIIGHVTFQIAFVALVVKSRLVSLSSDIEEAAKDLFASRFYIFRRITLPLLSPGIEAGAMLAFTLSLDDFVISFFTAGPQSITLPIYIFGAARRGVTPQIHAISTIILLITVVSVIAAGRLIQKNRQRRSITKDFTHL